MPWCLQRRFIDCSNTALVEAHGIVDESRGVVVFNRYFSFAGSGASVIIIFALISVSVMACAERSGTAARNAGVVSPPEV